VDGRPPAKIETWNLKVALALALEEAGGHLQLV
jgi:hypothetical protein